MTVIALAGSVVAAACATTARTPAGDVSSPAGVAAPGHWVSGEYANAAGSRKYQLYLPAGHDGKQKRMLVVLLHGCPESANAKKCWNWYDPAHQARDAGEPSIIAGMTGKVAADYPVDPGRVHLAGISAGAGMAALVAVAYPETYASVALHSGIAWRAATNVMTALGVMAKGPSLETADTLGTQAAAAMGARTRPIPALVIQGASDKVVNPANAAALTRQWTRMNLSARAGDEPQVAVVDDAGSDESSGEANGYHWTRASFGAGDSVVEELIVAELGHAWSGGSTTGTFTDEHGPDAMGEIVSFFTRHPRRGTR